METISPPFLPRNYIKNFDSLPVKEQCETSLHYLENRNIENQQLIDYVCFTCGTILETISK